MKSVTIRTKSIVVGVLLSLTVIGGALITTKVIFDLQREFNEVGEVDFRVLTLSKDIQYSVAQVQQWLTDISATRGLDGLNDGFDEAAEHAANFRRHLAEIQRLDPRNGHRYQAMVESFENYYSTGQRMANAYVKNGPAGGNPIMGDFDDAASTLIGQLNPLLDEIAVHTRMRIDRTEGQVQTLLITVVLVSAFILIVLAGAFYVGAVSIRSIERLGETIWQIANGDGDLTRRVEIRNHDEVGRVGDGFNRFVEVIAEMVGKVAETAGQLRRDAEKGSETMNLTSREIAVQKDNTLKVATAIEDFSASGVHSAERAADASAAVDATEKAAQEGHNSVVDVVSSINGLASEVKSASGVISKLESDSEQIDNILDVIKGIAEQTNLLALNAAIEAARAGEQGRGFAVVADEVRTLATRTQESTSEIQLTIEKIQQGTREAAKVMEKGRSIASSSIDIASETKDQLQSIVDDVKTINGVNSHVAQTTVEQNKMILSIQRSVEHISQVADRTAINAENTAALNRNVLELANQLGGVIGRFKL